MAALCLSGWLRLGEPVARETARLVPCPSCRSCRLVCPVLSARGRAGGRRQAPAASLDARAEGIMGIRSRPGSNCSWLQVTDSARSPVVRRIFLTLNPRKSKYTRSLTYYSSNTTILHRQSLYAAIDQHDPLPILRNPSTSIQSVTAVARLAHILLLVFQESTALTSNRHLVPS